MGRCIEVCRINGLKINACKSKVMVLCGEKGLVCEVCVDGMRLEGVSELKYLGRCFERIRYTDEVECRSKVASGRIVVGAIKCLVNASGLQLQRA